LEATATGENPGGGRLDKTADIQARANRTGGASWTKEHPQTGSAMAWPWRLVNRDLPAGILSTKDALDDGNAYGSGIAASCNSENMWAGCWRQVW